jgi:hypothetical protein
MTSLNLYHVCLPEGTHLGYDTYDSMVVAAASSDEARKIHPAGLDGWGFGWIAQDQINELVVTALGSALPTVEAGVIVASFNAG